MKKLLLTILFVSLYATVNAAPSVRYDVSVSPKAASTYSLGDSLYTWLYGYFDGICLGGVCRTSWPTGSGGGGGDGAFSTTTAWGSILNIFANNVTDLFSIGYSGSGVATSSNAEFVVDPTAKLGLFLNSTKVGIGTTSPYAPLSVVGQIVGGYFTATTSTASTFPLANITKLSNLTSNGFVKTSGGDGTLSVDTTTYESGLTAGDGLTRTVNDFDCDTASGSTFGCVTSADYTTFSNKQPAGNYITALTGDVTASGPGSAVATLATVNSNVGTYTNANITVNAKGLITAASNGTGGTGGTGTVGTSSVPVKGNLAYWTTDTATPALLSTVATTSVTCSGSTSCTPFTAIGSSPVTISSTASGGSGGGSWSTTTSSVSGQLINYPNNDTDIVTIGSNSTTTSEFYFDPNTKTAVLGLDTGFLGGRVYTNGLFGTKTQVMLTQPVNDLQSNLVIGNTYSGADGVYATGGITFVNGRSRQGSTFQTSDYYTYMGLAGPNFATFSGLPANGFVLSNTDGPIVIGATSANVASGTLAFAIGSGYAVGNYDAVIKNVDTAGSTNTASGGLGLGTTSPWARLAIAASSTATFPYLVVAQHINGAYTNASPVFEVHQNENVGVATGTPWARLSVNPNGISNPSFVIGSSTKTDFIVTNGGQVGIATSSPVSGPTMVFNAGSSILCPQVLLATSTSMTVSMTDGCHVVIRMGTSAATITLSGGYPGSLQTQTICNPRSTGGSVTYANVLYSTDGTAVSNSTTANACTRNLIEKTMATSTDIYRVISQTVVK